MAEQIKLIENQRTETTGEFTIETECGYTIAAIKYTNTQSRGPELCRADAHAAADLLFSAIKKINGMKEEAVCLKPK